MKFKVTYFDKVEEYEKKVKLLDLLPLDNKEYICARVNNRVRELNYEVYYDANIEFLTVEDSDATKIYEASLRYLIAMVFHRLYPEINIRFCYNVSRSVFIQFINKKVKVDQKMVNALTNEANKLIAEDLPFKRFVVTKEEAAEIYKERKLIDKLDILPYRPEKTVHLYDCEGYLNYMFSHMVPSTGYLKDFKLRLYSPGILLQYPRAECGGKIPPFDDAPIFGRTLKEVHKWAVSTGADTVSGINERIKEDGEIEFLNVCEARHNKMFVELGDRISHDISDIRLICIAGPSSSGKTTFANRLRVELISRGIRPIRISIDDYYLPRAQAPLDEDGKPSIFAPVMLATLSTCAQLERENIKFRLNSGRQLYIDRGGKLGRKQGSVKSMEKKKEEYKDVISYLKKGISIRNVAKLSSKSVSTVQRIKKEFIHQ